MTIGNLTEQDIKDLIIKFNLDESINDLKRYYSTPTTWEIINQSRKETRHTQFLAWFFGNKDFNADPNAGPIKKLIVLIVSIIPYFPVDGFGINNINISEIH